MYRLLLLILAPLILGTFESHAQDCSDPAPLCFEQFNNIQADSTDMGPLMGSFSCGSAMNGSLYEITTLAAGEFSVVISDVDCDSSLPTEGDTLIVEVFTSNSPLVPCDPAEMNTLSCVSIGVGATLTFTALGPDESYFVAIYGDMDAGDTEPADCGYNLQIDGPAVEFYMTIPDNPITALEGQLIEIEGVGGVEEYLWTGLGEITDDTLANPTIFPGPEGTYIYELMGSQGECTVNETITIIVTPNIIPTDIITPNADGRNDTWHIQSLDDRFESAEIKVFDRWGQIVFNSIGYGPEREWDGTNNGKKLPMGAYYYVIDLNINGQDTDPFIGDISIIY